LEFAVNATPSVIPELSFVKIEIPDSITSLDTGALPDNWREYPAPSALSMIGETWVRKNKSIALKVPSSIEPNSHNYILNCAHPEYEKVKIIDIEPFHIDIRLLKK
jgi:RES domain-containing protein